MITLTHTPLARRARRTSAAALAVAGALALAACSPGAGDAPDPAATGSETADDLVQAAQAEGSLTWYTGTTPTGAETVAQAFEEEYGVRVDVVRLTSNEIAQRFQAEAAAENTQADVLLTVAETFFVDMHEQGLTETLDPADFEGYPAEFALPGGAGLTTGVNLPVIVYNTDVLGDVAPQTWEDLLAPELKGQIVIADPRGSNAWAQYWSVLLRDEGLGEPFLEAIADQDFLLTASTVPGTQLVGAGEGGLLIAGTPGSTQPSIDQGLPLAMVTPSEPTVTGRNWVALVADAPHPNAGRLFVQWLVGEEGSRIYNSAEVSASPLGDLGGGVLSLPADAVAPPSAQQVEEDLPRVVELLRLQ
ncbi:ABC transporter substrate-binding protein [Microbacterium sp. No. 7]|uniref:ABC transporter substrate-binding protein n=1 Tax=Microbacterium sp. No. 7 TaxID=1714373 RepID=UPI0006D187C9|nr:extracellular solute-binding protein [Microbacterium sp. No. 7]ALJ18895.1 hypothetical protein AOA12_02810 [Microbacterium sp. No. 7]